MLKVDTPQLQSSNEFDLVDMLKTTNVFSEKHKKTQLSKVSTELNKQVYNSQANSNSNTNLTKNYNRHSDENIDLDSKDDTFIDNISIQNISRDKSLRHDNLPDLTTKNSTIGCFL